MSREREFLERGWQAVSGNGDNESVRRVVNDILAANNPDEPFPPKHLFRAFELACEYITALEQAAEERHD